MVVKHPAQVHVPHQEPYEIDQPQTNAASATSSLLRASTAGLVKNNFISEQSEGKLVLKSTDANVLWEELLEA